MKKFFFLPLLALLFLAVSCPRQDSPPKTPRPDELPPITQTGENTFGCLVNGKVWLPGGGGGASPVFYPRFSNETFTLSTERKEYNSSNQTTFMQTMLFSIKPVSDTGMHFIKNIDNGAEFIDWIKNQDYKVNYNDSLQNWVHIIRFDQKNSIISGTFNLFFTAPGHDTVRITQGRFDAKYTY